MKKVSVRDLIDKQYGDTSSPTPLITGDGYIGNVSFIVKKGFDEKIDKRLEKICNNEKNYVRRETSAEELKLLIASYKVTNVIEKAEIVKVQGKLISKIYDFDGSIYVNANYYRYMVEKQLDLYIEEGACRLVGKKGEEVIAVACGLRITQETWDNAQTLEEYEIEQEEKQKKKEELKIVTEKWNNKLADDWFNRYGSLSYINDIINADKKVMKNEFGNYAIYINCEGKWAEFCPMTQLGGIGGLREQKAVANIIVDRLNAIKEN